MDSIPRAHSAPPQVGTPPTAETVLGPGAVLEGTLWAAEPVRVLGTLRGTLEADRQVVVEAGGQVLARVSVPELVVAGLVDGPVHCAGRLEVRGGGQIKGHLQAGEPAHPRARPARGHFVGLHAPAAKS
jgi:cytoskeletal protein CcmA (bactofilin family)